MDCTDLITWVHANAESGLKNFTNTGDSVATLTFTDGQTLVIQPGASRALVVPAIQNGQQVCFTASCEDVVEPCTGLFDCDAANVVVNNGNPITCPMSNVPLELNFVDCNGGRVTSGFQGLQTDVGDVDFDEDLGNGRNLYLWNIFGGSTTGPTTATFTYGDPADLCTFTVTVPACEELDKQSELLADPNRCGYGENATGGTNLVEVSTEAEFYAAIAVSGNYVCLMPALANTTFIRNTTFASFADNLTIDGSLAPGFKVKVGPSMPTNGYLFRFFGDNIIIHDIEGEGIDFTTLNNQSFLNMYGENIWIDKVTGHGFDDDFINILLDADNITVSRIKSFNTNKSIIVFNPNPGQGDTKLTVHSSWMASNQRGPWLGAGMAHSFNNYIERTWAGAGRADAFFNHTDIGELISQNNVYENQLFQALIGFTGGNNAGFVQSVNDNLNGGSTSGPVTFSATPDLFPIPYNCDDILIDDTSLVKAYVQSVAGSN